VRHWSGQRCSSPAPVVIGLTAVARLLGGSCRTLVYAPLRSTGWTWARVALHLVGAAFATSLVVFVATTFGPGPGLLAGVVAILIWRWDHNRPMAVRMDAAEVPCRDRETQLEAAFAEGYNRGQREARRCAQAMERSVPPSTLTTPTRSDAAGDGPGGPVTVLDANREATLRGASPG